MFEIKYNKLEKGSCVYSCMTAFPSFVTCRCLLELLLKILRYATFLLQLCFNLKLNRKKRTNANRGFNCFSDS